jgi:hypothetical protein
MMKKTLLLPALIFALNAVSQNNPVAQTFRDTRVINGHSVETSPLGEMKFIISHRFGYVNTGAYEMFGFDQSTIRLGLDYGFSDRFTVGIGRSSYQKTLDGFAKYRLLKQKENGFPLSLTAFSSINCNTLKWENPERDNFFTSRLSYSHQLIFARKFSDAFSWQLMPTLVHLNLVPTVNDEHDIIALGSATRLQVSKSISLTTEYYYVITEQLAQGLRNALAIGVDIETKGHVFQLHLSNSRGMIEKFFITDTQGRWEKGEISLGFNITRDFRLRGR